MRARGEEGRSPDREARSDPLNPEHYKAGGLEAIDVIEGFGLGFCLGNTLKYLLRHGRKAGAPAIEDLEKARWYLDREIARRRREADKRWGAPSGATGKQTPRRGAPPDRGPGQAPARPGSDDMHRRKR